MKKISVLWYEGNSLISHVVKRVTGSPFSHVAIQVGDVVYESARGGVKAHRGDDAVAKRLDAEMIIELPVGDADERQMRFWLENRVGNGYSVLGFIAAGLAKITGYGLIVSFPGQYICSGLVATALQIGGYLPLVDPLIETPASIYDQLSGEEVAWTG